MSKCIEHREFIPVAEVPAEIPDGIAAKYYVRWPGSFHEITQDNVKRIMKNLRSGNWMDIYLYHEDDEEGDYLDLETDGTLYDLSYGEDMGANRGGPPTTRTIWTPMRRPTFRIPTGSPSSSGRPPPLTRRR